MGRNSSWELDLHPQVMSETDHGHNHNNYFSQSMVQKKHESRQHIQQHQQKHSIAYNGNDSVCDVSEHQALAMFSLPTREMDYSVQRNSTVTLVASSPILQSRPQLYHPSIGLAMKRSLQRFLSKRKSRIQSASPYNLR